MKLSFLPAKGDLLGEIVRENGTPVCVFHEDPPKDLGKLFAAAPDMAAENKRMRATMKECADLIDHLYPLDQKTANQIRDDLREALLAHPQPAEQ